MALPGLPVVGSMGVRLPSLRPSALFVTQSVLRSHEGTTCCGPIPTRNRSTTLRVCGSMTYTSCDCRLGTYTRGRALATSGLGLFPCVSLYRLPGSTTGGIPGIVSIAGADDCAVSPNGHRQVVSHSMSPAAITRDIGYPQTLSRAFVTKSSVPALAARDLMAPTQTASRFPFPPGPATTPRPPTFQPE